MKGSHDEASKARRLAFPSARRSAGAVVHGGAFWMYGGFGISGTLDPWDIGADLWRYDRQWSALEEKGPYPARYVSLCSDGDGIFMFGGCGHDGARMIFMNDLWYYRRHWRCVPCKAETKPEGRYTCALAISGERLIVFGGHSQQGGGKMFYGDLWVFELPNQAWTMIHGEGRGPGKRYGFGWTASEECLYIFGGYDGDKDLGDLWALHLADLSWKRVADTGPEARFCPAMGIVDGRLVLFGGRSKVNPKRNFQDTWVYDEGWRCVDSSTASGPGYHAKAAYASDGKTLWVFGGEGSHGHMSDLWRHENSSWHLLHDNADESPSFW